MDTLLRCPAFAERLAQKYPSGGWGIRRKAGTKKSAAPPCGRTALVYGVNESRYPRNGLLDEYKATCDNVCIHDEAYEVNALR